MEIRPEQDAEKLCGLTIDMHALMEYHYEEVVCTNSMVYHRLNFFQQWLSDFFNGGKLQTSQTSLFPILSADAFRKMPDLVVLDLSRSCLIDAWKGKPFLPKLKVLDLCHSRDLIRTPDFLGLPALEKLILEDCIRLVQMHESIGDLQRLLILNLRNYTTLMELPEEMSRLNSLQELVLDGCSNLNNLNMELEHHQGRTLLQSDGIVASTSFISSLPLKLFFPSRFSTRKMLRFTSFSLPRFLESLDLSGTPIRFLPESIKDLGLLRALYLRNCKMLQALPEFLPYSDSLDVSYCYSLQRLANLHHWTFAEGCDHLIIFDHGKFNVYVFVEDEMLRGFYEEEEEDKWLIQNEFVDNFSRGFYEEEEEDKWLIQNEFVDNFSFKISSSPPAHRIFGFNLFISCVMSAYRDFSNGYVEIRNNTSGLSMLCLPYHDEVINAHNSSDDAHAAKEEIASLIFRNYYCGFHANVDGGNGCWWSFAKRGLELARYPK
ncbi:hypothetical protein NC653_018074 [Populus alba x Populus x berolinensis]|uniref:Uncharacterized protein n=1 Tax=Populus alba x Populus x berolinensis TaxID=444605 RepID=A0AAD6QS08_9ROSI|nr:hypothetical protein NC653_018074 [Populus alba x Populus x berolinensis]